MPFDIGNLIAIDTHVHIESEVEGNAAAEAAKKYFGESGVAPGRSRRALAEYYRARKIGCLFVAVVRRRQGRRARQRSRQQAAEDLLWIIEHFADSPALTGRSTYKALVTIFHQQCEVTDERVVVKAKTGGDRVQNPSDPDATYDAHKGPGYQVQIAETCGPGNDVQLITAALPQTACESDGAAVVPMLDQLEGSGLLPEEMTADTPYCGDENVQAAAARGVELVGPIPGRQPRGRPAALTLDDFAVDERTGQVEACPSGHAPLVVERDAEAGTTRLEMAAEVCGGCPFRAACPIHTTRDGRYELEFSDKDHRLAGRRREQETPVFAERYATRAGIESTNSGLKNRLGLKRLRVRGRGSVSRVILHKVAGWNVLRAAASKELRSVDQDPGGRDAQRGGSWGE